MKKLITSIGKYLYFDVDVEMYKDDRKECAYGTKELFGMNYAKDYFNEKVHMGYFGRNGNVKKLWNGWEEVYERREENESGFFSNVESLEKINEDLMKGKVKRNEEKLEDKVFKRNERNFYVSVIKKKKTVQKEKEIVKENINEDKKFYEVFEKRKAFFKQRNISSNENDNENTHHEISISENATNDDISYSNIYTHPLSKQNKSLIIPNLSYSKLFTSQLLNNRKLMKQ